MQTITISVDDSITQEQIDFLTKSVLLQAEAEMKKVLVVPKEDIDAVETKVTAMKEANGVDIAVDIAPKVIG